MFSAGCVCMCRGSRSYVASDPNPATLTIIGALLAAITGGGGLYLNARKGSDDAMASIVNAALAVSDRNSADIDKYIARMDEQDRKIEQLTLAVAHCESEHMKARTALANAGIAYR